MNKQIMLLTLFCLSLSSMAQEPAATNTVSLSTCTNNAAPTNSFKQRRDREPGQAKKNRKSEYRLQLMERELNRIGVSEEERAQVKALQQLYKEKMSANSQQIEAAREKLSKLLDAGASMETLEAAIQEVSTAQTEQLRILVMNRIEMERILGKEKYAEFMKKARMQFQKHGRHGGPPLPPRPGQTGPPTPRETPPSP